MKLSRRSWKIKAEFPQNLWQLTVLNDQLININESDPTL